jgi:hypothetical protein
MGALNPLLCISSELHRNGAVLGILKGARGLGWTEKGVWNSSCCLELTQLDTTEVNICQHLL